LALREIVFVEGELWAIATEAHVTSTNNPMIFFIDVCQSTAHTSARRPLNRRFLA
jgi:hypothetical protein